MITRKSTFAALLLATAPASYAEIVDFKQINIDFTNSADATTNATWSEPDKIAVTKAGLGWDGEGAASRQGWIQTKAVALGLSWRPTYAISVRVTIHPPPQEISLRNGQKTTPDEGDVYVRYSPDLKNWSSWQALQRAESQSIQEKKQPGWHYSGMIRVPDVERVEYTKLVSEYVRMDVPWKSDEEATVQWILKSDPEFFSKHIPFIGYAEFRYEGRFAGGQRIQSFKADISYSMSGLHAAPRDGAIYEKRDVPWRYGGPDPDVRPTR